MRTRHCNTAQHGGSKAICTRPGDENQACNTNHCGKFCPFLEFNCWALWPKRPLILLTLLNNIQFPFPPAMTFTFMLASWYLDQDAARSIASQHVHMAGRRMAILATSGSPKGCRQARLGMLRKIFAKHRTVIWLLSPLLLLENTSWAVWRRKIYQGFGLEAMIRTMKDSGCGPTAAFLGSHRGRAGSPTTWAMKTASRCGRTGPSRYVVKECGMMCPALTTNILSYAVRRYVQVILFLAPQVL